MANNPITDAAMAELDRLHAAATPGEWRPEVPAWNKHRRNCKTAISSPTGTVLNTVTPKVPRDGVIGYRPPGECKIAQYIAALHNAYPALRQRLLDAESRLAEVERERGSNDALKQACDRHHEAYKVAERERVALVKRSHNQRVEIGRLIEQLTAATARAEAAEAIVATLRGALEESRKDNEELDGTDAAHPAWWRGNDAGVAQVCAQINAIIDGADVFGTAAEPWESTRRRVAEARRDSELLAWAWANPDKFTDAQRSTPPNRTGRQQIDAARGTK